MNVSEVYGDLFGRIPELVERAVEDLDREQLAHRPTPSANSVGWLVWHLTRVLDGYVADLRNEQQVWLTEGLAARFGMEPDPGESGYGHTSDDVARVRPESADALLAYLAPVVDRVAEYAGTLTPDALDRVVDERWDPPVTLGVRLVSIADDAIQHAGQAAYLRGLILDR